MSTPSDWWKRLTVTERRFYCFCARSNSALAYEDFDSMEWADQMRLMFAYIRLRSFVIEQQRKIEEMA